MVEMDNSRLKHYILSFNIGYVYAKSGFLILTNLNRQVKSYSFQPILF